MYSQGRGDAILQCPEMPTLPSSWFVFPSTQLPFANQLEQPSGPPHVSFPCLHPASNPVDAEVARQVLRGSPLFFFHVEHGGLYSQTKF